MKQKDIKPALYTKVGGQQDLNPQPPCIKKMANQSTKGRFFVKFPPNPFISFGFSIRQGRERTDRGQANDGGILIWRNHKWAREWHHDFRWSGGTMLSRFSRHIFCREP